MGFIDEIKAKAVIIASSNRNKKFDEAIRLTKECG